VRQSASPRYLTRYADKPPQADSGGLWEISSKSISKGCAGAAGVTAWRRGVPAFAPDQRPPAVAGMDACRYILKRSAFDPKRSLARANVS